MACFFCFFWGGGGIRCQKPNRYNFQRWTQEEENDAIEEENPGSDSDTDICSAVELDSMEIDPLQDDDHLVRPEHEHLQVIIKII